MAYSDYGGYAYKNGVRVEDRSDAVLSPEGIKSTPGAWPGWFIPEGRSCGSYHALLGDGPIFIGLYKQSTCSIHRLGEELEKVDYLENPTDEMIDSGDYYGKPYREINRDYFIDNDLPCILNVDGHKIEIKWTHEDNYYIYVCLTQPDGNVWTGFSGYGVGAGLEDAGYGYSTSRREDRLTDIFRAA